MKWYAESPATKKRGPFKTAYEAWANMELPKAEQLKQKRTYHKDTYVWPVLESKDQ